MKLNLDFSENFYSENEFSSVLSEAKNALDIAKEKNKEGKEPLGWYSLPEDYDREEFDRILAAAEKIRTSCEVFVVIGIGGSYLGARAAIEFLQGNFHNDLRQNGPRILFAGTGTDGDALSEIIALCENKEICVNVISKSGTTTEPAIAFRVFRELVEKRYGVEGARDRIFVTTDRREKPGTLKEFAVRQGYECFVVPDNIGGRYSVLTAVGLLPIAVSGADIGAMLQGALEAKRELTVPTDDNLCLRYAALRNLFYRNGRKMELFASFAPTLEMTGEWLKQLFGESEGKDLKGIFPVSAIYSRDLHSLGQYVQEGERTIFETFLYFDTSAKKLPIPVMGENVDGLQYLEGKDMDFVNQNTVVGTAQAHRDGGTPVLILTLPKRDEKTFGYMVYFFELACAVSGYTLGVNPFDQPGVEAYKKNLFRLLGKPGYTKE